MMIKAKSSNVTKPRFYSTQSNARCGNSLTDLPLLLTFYLQEKLLLEWIKTCHFMLTINYCRVYSLICVLFVPFET